MADNYAFKKRQRELAQKKKMEERMKKRLEKKNPPVQVDSAEQPAVIEDEKGAINGI